MVNQAKKERFALITVSHRQGLEAFARGLEGLGFGIVASRGTAAHLRRHGIEVIDVESLTGYPPIVGKQGIKLIHPVIFGGILADLGNPAHRRDLKRFGIRPFELVACNFYPFEETVARRRIDRARAVENIDIGGPAMVRCAAKNFANTTIVTDPADYDEVLQELRTHGHVRQATRRELALKAFRFTKVYDEAIIKYLSDYFAGRPE